MLKCLIEHPAMLRLPILTALRLLNYGLFPGRPAGSGLEWAFEDGVSLIAGVNGLGKTTLLTVLLRCLTGPFDLTGYGIPDQLESVLPAEPVSLKPAVKRFFGQRVADDAKTATAELQASFGTDKIEIVRNLSDLTLVRFTVNSVDQVLPPHSTSAERNFQEKICGLFGLGSFIDVLLIVHHIVFFTEDRPGALWDENAQRQILRALFLDIQLAKKVAELEREVGSADSNARNHSAAAFGIQQRVEAARDREQRSPGALADLALEQKLLDAELEERERLTNRLSDLDDDRKDARRQLEHAKAERERAENKVEELKLAVLARLFPKMEDSARLVVLKALASGECLVCGADARGRRDELERLLAGGVCPSCGAEPERQEHVVPPFVVERTRVKLARNEVDRFLTAEKSSAERMAAATAQYDQTLDRLEALRVSIAERKNRTRRLSTLLPMETEEITRLQDALEETRRAQRSAESRRAACAKKLAVALEQGRIPIQRKTKQLATDFRAYTRALLSEDVELVRIVTKAKITQGKETFEVPAFRPQMAAADRPGLTLRRTPADVSESQRELIDLAFRLALIKLATGKASCTFIMETPEASLDELAMGRVGKALFEFANEGNNRLISTTNLTNAGMIASIFGGPVKRAVQIADRKKRVLNLLQLAAPNQAVLKNRKKYEQILESALAGKDQHG
jgi:hypothetical protein